MSRHPSACWHLLAGSTGAGKSTMARDLAQRMSAVRFSIDEWMSALYWMDCPLKNDLPWALDRIERCEAQMEAAAVQLAQIGVDAVFDLGFTQVAQRMAWLDRAKRAGVRCELHVLDVPQEIRWLRVRKRNRDESETFSFEVTREMFDFMEQRWELPDEEELAKFSAS